MLIFDKELFIKKEGMDAYLKQELPYGNWIDDFDGVLVEKTGNGYSLEGGRIRIDIDWCQKR